MSQPRQFQQRYQQVLEIFEREGAVIESVHLASGRLQLKATAVSEASKTRIWNALRLLDPTYTNVDPEISIRQGEQTYVVKPGDDLTSISRFFYGDVNHRSVIAMANAMVDPDRIRAGQQLRIPSA